MAPLSRSDDNGRSRGLTRAEKGVAIVATLVVWATSLLSAAIWAATDRTQAFNNIENNSGRVAAMETRLQEYEQRLRSIETSTTKIESNVEWIRKSIEQRYPPE